MAEKKNLPIGVVITKGGTAHEYVTGGWRKLRPVLDKGKCTNCLICWVMCPDSAVIVEDGKMIIQMPFDDLETQIRAKMLCHIGNEFKLQDYVNRLYAERRKRP